jgi:hypothetical protein
VKNSKDWRSLLKISAMSLGAGVIQEFAPLIAYHAENEIADFFRRARNPITDGNILRAQQYLSLNAD